MTFIANYITCIHTTCNVHNDRHSNISEHNNNQNKNDGHTGNKECVKKNCISRIASTLHV